MIFNICYKNRGTVLLSVDVYIKSEEFFNESEEFFNDKKKWRVDLNTKIIGTGITRFVFETIKDDTSLRILQNKLLPLEELRGWLHNSREFNYNSYTTLEEASKRKSLVIKTVREKLNEFCDSLGKDLYINED
jgi:hypothetical protein